MLYPTHKKYGILWGLLMIPFSVIIGLIPVITMEMRNGDMLLIILACYMGMRGALFGARFPDIDSPGSIPARRHPHLRRVFAFFKIKHRGKFSHDYATIGVLFFLLYKLVDAGGVRLLTAVAKDGSMLSVVVYVGSLIFVYMAGLDIVSFFQWVAGLLKNKRMWAILERRRFPIAGINVIWLMIVFISSGKVNIGELLTGTIPLATSMFAATMIVISFKVYALFAWAGAYSHLFADMTTKSGVVRHVSL